MTSNEAYEPGMGNRERKLTQSFNAFVVNKDDSGFSAGVKRLALDDLPEGDVTVRVHYSRDRKSVV